MKNHESERYAFTMSLAEFERWLTFDSIRWSCSGDAWEIVSALSRVDVSSGLRCFLGLLPPLHSGSLS